MPSDTIKQCQTEEEHKAMRDANIKESLTMLKYFKSLQDGLAAVPESGALTEQSAYEAIYKSRFESEVCKKMHLISAAGANSSKIGYQHADTPAKLETNQVYLIDMACEYADGGVSDIARTFWIGDKQAPKDVKEAYTRVIIGIIGYERIVWPAGSGISGYDMEVLARQALWKAGLHFKHGSAHGAAQMADNE
jgi:Xaa-Pro aminopeptidase